MTALSANLLADLRREVSCPITDAPEVLTQASSDFGRIIHRQPRVVVFPESTGDVAKVVRYASNHGVKVHVQGGLHSQAGQALSEGGIVLSLKRALNRIRNLNIAAQTVEVESGCVWRDLVNRVAPDGLLPVVLTNNLNVTVGGTLSMGGIGVASYRAGAQGDNVSSVEIVTGTGDIVHCDDTTNPELFLSVFTTLGQFGVITAATLKLRRFQPMCRTYHLLHDDLSKCLADYEMLMVDERFDYLESFVAPCVQGIRRVEDRKQAFAQWFYPLHGTKEFTPGAEPKKERMLDGLKPYKFVHVEDQPTVEYMLRMEPVFEAWKMLGTWEHAHPWMECILPWEVTSDYIANVLENFPPGALIGGHILLWPSRNDSSRLPLFMRPEGKFVMGFGILPALNKDFLALALPKLNMASNLSMMMGGKRYLSGYLEFEREQWATHFGDKWPDFKRLKAQFDPKHTLNPGFVDYDA